MKTQNEEQSLIQSLEKSIRSILSIGAIIYAWGFIVVSIYLSQYSVVSLNLLRIQYILAGIWIIVPIIIFTIALSWFFSSIYYQYFENRNRINPPDTRKMRFMRILVGLLAGFMSLSFCYWVTTNFISWSAPNVFAQFTPLSISDVLKLIVFCFGIDLSILFSWALMYRTRAESGKGDFLPFFSAVTGFSFAGLMIIGYTFYFAINIYPKIPSFFGGGQPIEVRFILAHDDNYESLRDSLHFVDDQELSPTVRLVTTTENDYIIIDPTDSRRVILLPQKSVSLFIFESK
jgi:hypothetical protein